MTALPLRLGPLEAAGRRILRSGLRWLRPDGHVCRANEIVAYCNIALAGGAPALAEEGYDLQVALAPRLPGRIRHAPGASRGGYLDRLPVADWHEDAIWAHLEGAPASGGAAANEPELLFLAGRRFTGIADNRTGLLTGWHDRARAWWGDGGGSTLLAAGICELDGIFRGDDGTFGSFFQTAAGPAQVVLSQDEPLVPCAAVLAEQLARTPKEVAAIREDMARSFPIGRHVPTAEEWLFMGALLNALEHCPLGEDYEMLGRSGLSRTGPADAICLSLTAEMAQLPRHRRLGYAINFHGFRLGAIGPAVRDWLRSNFEVGPQSVADVAADYRRLIAAAPGRAFFVVNRLSSQLYEQIQNYHGLDEAAMAGLSSVRAKELNLMLHDLARAVPDLAIVDADAIAADLGMAQHLPDGIHGSGAFYSEVRNELLRLVHAQGIQGFGPRALSRS